MRRARFVAIVAALLGLICMVPARPAGAQPPDQVPPPPLRVFLDCWECDTEFIRRQVVFVDYVRDRADADLHVLVTTQNTGGGGTSWTVRFIGLGRFEGDDRARAFTTPQNATNDDRRTEFARQFRIGLAGYALDTAVAPDLQVSFRPPAAGAGPPAAQIRDDPWNRWVFRVNGNLSTNGEASRQSRNYRFSFSGNRVTEAWKSSASVSLNSSRSDFTLSDGREVKSRSDGWNLNSTVVKSAGPRFSIGSRFSASHSSFSNTDRAIALYPGFEFNVFPYSEYERRSFTIWWEAGPNFYDYREVTIYDRLTETVFKHQMDVSLRLRQPWGSGGMFSSLSQDLRRPGRYRASISGDADVRLFRGFSFNVYAQYSRIKDQIALPRAGATTEEILLQIRQLSTDYSYSMSVGFSYSFGSIFTNVVNPRFGGPGSMF
jgi:hypothetical protein